MSSGFFQEHWVGIVSFFGLFLGGIQGLIRRKFITIIILPFLTFSLPLPPLLSLSSFSLFTFLPFLLLTFSPFLLSDHRLSLPSTFSGFCLHCSCFTFWELVFFIVFGGNGSDFSLSAFSFILNEIKLKVGNRSKTKLPLYQFIMLVIHSPLNHLRIEFQLKQEFQHILSWHNHPFIRKSLYRLRPFKMIFSLLM